jgi:hypothetical protein
MIAKDRWGSFTFGLFRGKDVVMATAGTSDLRNWQRFVNRAASLRIRYPAAHLPWVTPDSLDDFR